MAIGVLHSSGYLSSLPVSEIGNPNYDPYYVLQENNETINFIDGNGVQRYFNSLLIEAESTDLKINIGGYILYVPANESRNYDYEKISEIQVMNLLGTKIRFSGMFF